MNNILSFLEIFSNISQPCFLIFLTFFCFFQQILPPFSLILKNRTSLLENLLMHFFICIYIYNIVILQAYIIYLNHNKHHNFFETWVYFNKKIRICQYCFLLSYLIYRYLPLAIQPSILTSTATYTYIKRRILAS